MIIPAGDSMMAMRWRAAALACAMTVGTAVAARAQCANLSAPTTTLDLNAQAIAVGQPVRATIRHVGAAAAPRLQVCLDRTEPLTASDVSTSGGDVAFNVTIPEEPNRPSGPLPLGDHTISVVATDESGRTLAAAERIVRHRPRLDSVAAVPLTEQNRTFRVALKGDGFDDLHPANNRIRFNGSIKDVCWSDCTSSTTMVGAVSGPHEIVLSKIEPAEEARVAFEVCYRDETDGHCSAAVRDVDAASATRITLGWSFGAMAAIIVLVIGIVMWCGDRIKIGDNTYWIRRLFIDRETDTYSLSKVQFYIWTAVAVFGYAYLTVGRNRFQYWIGLPAIPSGLPGIVGIAGGTAVGAQVVTKVNGPKGAGQMRPSLSDLITTGDVVAVERVQFLVWTLVGAIGYLLVIMRLDPRAITDLPEVPESLLMISGISAFGYLGGKLARNPGPVINEVIVHKGPDPALAKAEPSTASTSTDDASSPASTAQPPTWMRRITAATATIGGLQSKLTALAAAPTIQTAIDAARNTIDAAVAAATDVAKLSSSSPAGDVASARRAIDARVATSSAAAADAANAVGALAANGTVAPADLGAATSAAAIAQSAANAVQDLQASLASVSSAGGATATMDGGVFGLLEIRGRMLSQDATFKIAVDRRPGDEKDVDHPTDVQISFDRLVASPDDSQQIQKPRVIERDEDARSPSVAKRLLLVVRLDDETSPFFEPETICTLTIVNPDSQKVVFRYDVPRTQKAS